MRLLVITPTCDGQGVGETSTSYNWVKRLAHISNLTLLTSYIPKRKRPPERIPPSEQLPEARVVEWDEFPYSQRFRRASGALAPDYLSFYFRSRWWIKRALAKGEKFDLIHQLSPLAMPYPSPATGLGIPYIIGPLASSISTPPAFASEMESEPLYMRLREFDDLRLRYDPWLRRTYEEAEIVLCSGPLARERLSGIPIKRCEVMCEVGVSDLAEPKPQRSVQLGSLKMVHVGRTVRTKGLRDGIRALAMLSDLPNVTLDVAGDGEDLEACREEAQQRGVSSRVRFLGRLSREQVEQIYTTADLFLFPSFREPTGIVLFEAMRHGLPVITTDKGGPGHIINDMCGIRIPVNTPQQFAEDIAAAVRAIALDSGKLASLGAGARQRVLEIGLWDRKIEVMQKLYLEVAKHSSR